MAFSGDSVKWLTMTAFTRRNLLSGAAGAATGMIGVSGQPVRAAAPLGGKQADGWYRYRVGGIEVTVATDGVARFNPKPR